MDILQVLQLMGFEATVESAQAIIDEWGEADADGMIHFRRFLQWCDLDACFIRNATPAADGKYQPGGANSSETTTLKQEDLNKIDGDNEDDNSFDSENEEIGIDNISAKEKMIRQQLENVEVQLAAGWLTDVEATAAREEMRRLNEELDRICAVSAVGYLLSHLCFLCEHCGLKTTEKHCMFPTPLRECDLCFLALPFCCICSQGYGAAALVNELVSTIGPSVGSPMISGGPDAKSVSSGSIEHYHVDDVDAGSNQPAKPVEKIELASTTPSVVDEHVDEDEWDSFVEASESSAPAATTGNIEGANPVNDPFMGRSEGKRVRVVYRVVYVLCAWNV